MATFREYIYFKNQHECKEAHITIHIITFDNGWKKKSFEIEKTAIQKCADELKPFKSHFYWYAECSECYTKYRREDYIIYNEIRQYDNKFWKKETLFPDDDNDKYRSNCLNIEINNTHFIPKDDEWDIIFKLFS